MRKSHSGFTLVEMIAVIIIIGLVAAFVGPRIFGQGDEARSRLAKAQISDIAGKMELFKLDVGRYPSSAEGLRALVANPGGVNNWNGPYAKEEQIKDPWGNEFKYAVPGKAGPFDITSLGADGKEGGDGANRDVSL